jgi:DNA-binding transcriptional ArsR family regulator
MPTVREKPGPDYDAEDVLVVSDREQLRALADDLRTKIIALLRDRARSTQELAEELVLPKGTVGHHLKVLERAGLIHVVRTRKVRALTEKFYGRTARLFVFRVEDEADERALASVAMRQAAEELARAPEGAHFAFVRARLAPADAKRLKHRLDRLIDDFRAAETADGVLHALTTGFWNTEARDA